MPRIAVEIEWDWPDDPFWLNPDNVSLALHAYCKNTKFSVRALKEIKMTAELAELDITPERGEPCT